jgi:uncharacterized protein YabE (DUF348 family)/3D (Asp-Asp-Asp) domain-containing protein
MGTFNSHTARSSGKLGALRLLVLVGIAAALAAGLFAILWEQSDTKRVTLIVGDKVETFETKAETVQELLASRNIEVSEHDALSHALTDELHHNDRVRVEHAIAVTVRADGRNIVHYTTEDTVADVLAELGLEPGEEDRIEPALDQTVHAGGTIRIVRVETVVEEVEEPIPYETVTVNDANMLKGKSAVVQEGKEGRLVKKYRIVREDGVEVSRTLIDETVAEPSVNKVVAMGTKNPVVVLSTSSPNVETVTKDGISFGVKKVLKNVKLTAYHAGADSTGKEKGDPGYGKTYTGTTATEGRTIAVDPKVIPLGWWVYIDGIGFRRAEDIGGAVKGNKIDIYFEDDEYARKFGTKSGYTVYIIGPKKPEAQ